MQVQIAEAAGYDAALLDRVMKFRHVGLLYRFQDKLGTTPEEAEKLFNDMKQFLFLAGTVSGPLAPPEKIDEAWHNFILFTKDYQEFCRRYFGKFIHHVPVGPESSIPKDGSAMRKVIEAAREVFGGSLSPNWGTDAAKCDKCAPSTNCQSGKPCSQECSKETEAFAD